MMFTYYVCVLIVRLKEMGRELCLWENIISEYEELLIEWKEE